MIKNKKGAMLPRDVIMIILTFSAIIALSSIFVNQMGSEYGNTNMTTSYNQDSIGGTMLQDNAETWEGIAEDLSGENGVIQMLGGTLEATGQIFLEILVAPHTFATMISQLFVSLGVEEVEGSIDITDIIEILVTAILYIIIIFGIIKALLRGGDI